MTSHDDVQRQVSQLARELQTLRQEQAASARHRRWTLRSLAAFSAVAVLVGGVQTALAAGSCPQTLPAPLTTFCADDPARASELNLDLQQLVDWLQQKAGPVGSPNVTITGNQTVGGTQTVTGKVTAQAGLDVTGLAVARTGLDVTGNVLARNALTVQGAASVATATVGSNLAVNGGLVSGNSVPLCIETWDCTSHTDTCATGTCPAGKVAAGAVMPTSCGGSTNHSVRCCRLRLVAATSGGACP